MHANNSVIASSPSACSTTAMFIGLVSLVWGAAIKATIKQVVVKQEEYFLFQDKKMNMADQGIKIHPDAIIYCTSGMLDAGRKRILSYLQKAIKPVNQLRMMEDSLVIYRISRAPERRIICLKKGPPRAI